MTPLEELMRENEALRERLALMSQASLRINESLDFDTVLQGVLDSARSLTGARYGAITLFDDSGSLVNLLFSGVTRQEAQRFQDLPDGVRFLEYLSAIPGPLRVPDLTGHFRSMGLPDFQSPIAGDGPISFLLAPIFHQGERAGTFHLAGKEGGREFTQEDEETLGAVRLPGGHGAIANARRHREERRTRADLETLINTSPVGVVVFDAATGLSPSPSTGRRCGSCRPPARPGPDAGGTAGRAELSAGDGRGGSPCGNSPWPNCSAPGRR